MCWSATTNERWKIVFLRSWLFSSFSSSRAKIRKSYLKHSFHGPNNKHKNKHFQRHLNERKLISFLACCSEHWDRYAVLSLDKQTNNKTRTTFSDLRSLLRGLRFGWHSTVLSKLSITNYQQKKLMWKKPRHSFIKIFIIMMCGEL